MPPSWTTSHTKASTTATTSPGGGNAPPNPVATITVQGGAQIVIELLPALAPNTVSSFIHLASSGAFDDYAIARVEPGFVVDVSTNAFGREICRYLIRNEAAGAGVPGRLRPELGTVAMGGYGGNIAGGEFFFPLAWHERLDGHYPCFGKVVSGVGEIARIGSGPVRPFAYCHNPENIMHKPLRREVLSSVRVETHGIVYPQPVRLVGVELPRHWLMKGYDERI